MSATATGSGAGLLPRVYKGKHADMIIHVRVTEEGEAGGRTTDIEAHSGVLCARSSYFDHALSGQERRVELNVANQQELAILKLLIKLSYSDSYTHDGGRLLPLETRLRLAERADTLEFLGALDQIVASLPLELTFEGALKCKGDDLPAAVEQHKGMAAARSAVVPVLVKGIEEHDDATDEDTKQLLSAAAVALAKYLGPVAGMAAPINNKLSLHADVKSLPPAAFKRFLASEALQLQLEDEAYTLCVAWLEQSPHVPEAQRLAMFKELVPLLRYHHITLDFLAAAVSRCPLMQASHLWYSVSRAGMSNRGVQVTGCSPNRGVARSKAQWEVKATFTLEEVAALGRGEALVKWCGWVAGYEAGLQVERRTGNGDDTLGAFLAISMRQPENELPGDPTPGVGLAVEMQGPLFYLRPFSHRFTGIGRGYRDIFRKPWAEAARRAARSSRTASWRSRPR